MEGAFWLLCRGYMFLLSSRDGDGDSGGCMDLFSVARDRWIDDIEHKLESRQDEDI